MNSKEYHEFIVAASGAFSQVASHFATDDADGGQARRASWMETLADVQLADAKAAVAAYHSGIATFPVELKYFNWSNFPALIRT